MTGQVYLYGSVVRGSTPPEEAEARVQAHHVVPVESVSVYNEFQFMLCAKKANRTVCPRSLGQIVLLRFFVLYNIMISVVYFVPPILVKPVVSYLAVKQ